jgi:hypothetical protein
MKIKLEDIHVAMFFLVLILCATACSGSSMMPLPASLTGSNYNAQGQLTGQAVRADLQNNSDVVDQQEHLLTQVRKSIQSLKSTMISLFTRADKKIEQLKTMAQGLPDEPVAQPVAVQHQQHIQSVQPQQQLEQMQIAQSQAQQPQVQQQQLATSGVFILMV